MPNEPSDGRLAGWKEIAAYFGRDDRTVMRWEKDRGLPVRRVPGSGKASVYAYKEDLKRWLDTTDQLDDAPVLAAAGAVAERPREGLRERTLAGTREERREAAGEDCRDKGRQRGGVGGGGRGWSFPRGRWVAIAAAIVVAVAVGSVVYGRHTVAGPAAFRVHSKAANPVAEELYLRGLYYWNKRTPDDLQRAADLFVQAIVVDPKFAPAYAGLADSYNLLREFSAMPSESAYPRAKIAAERAIALDDQLAPAHRSLAYVDFYWSWDIAGAQHECERALALDPLSATTHHWYANSLMQLGRFAEARAQIDRAQELEPTSKAILSDKGLLLWIMGQPDEGVKLLKEIETSDPDFLSPHSYLWHYYLARGDDRNAIAEMRQTAAIAHNTEMSDLAAEAERGFQRGGHTGALQAMLALQRRRLARGEQSAYRVAETEAQLGEDSSAIAHLQQAYASHDNEMTSLRSDVLLRPLHRDTAFRHIVARVGLPPLADSE
jgi:tetratricopeptide (TPR) repeat protein